MIPESTIHTALEVYIRYGELMHAHRFSTHWLRYISQRKLYNRICLYALVRFPLEELVKGIFDTSKE